MAEVALVNGNGNPRGFVRAISELESLLKKGPEKPSDLGRLLALGSEISRIQRKNGSETLERLAKGTMRAISDKPFRPEERRKTYSRWSNHNGSLTLEVDLKDPIRLAEKLILLEQKGPMNGNGKIASPLDGIIHDEYRMRVIVDGNETDAYNIYRRLIGFMDGAYVKDYVKDPKPNGYSALHIIGVPKCSIERGEPILVEIQITTKEAHEWAVRGGANHPEYKDKKFGGAGINHLEVN